MPAHRIGRRSSYPASGAAIAFPSVHEAEACALTRPFLDGTDRSDPIMFRSGRTWPRSFRSSMLYAISLFYAFVSGIASCGDVDSIRKCVIEILNEDHDALREIELIDEIRSSGDAMDVIQVIESHMEELGEDVSVPYERKMAYILGTCLFDSESGYEARADTDEGVRRIFSEFQHDEAGILLLAYLSDAFPSDVVLEKIEEILRTLHAEMKGHSVEESSPEEYMRTVRKMDAYVDACGVLFDLRTEAAWNSAEAHLSSLLKSDIDKHFLWGFRIHARALLRKVTGVLFKEKDGVLDVPEVEESLAVLRRCREQGVPIDKIGFFNLSRMDRIRFDDFGDGSYGVEYGSFLWHSHRHRKIWKRLGLNELLRLNDPKLGEWIRAESIRRLEEKEPVQTDRPEQGRRHDESETEQQWPEN